jgi:hypothetical protein
MSGYRSRFNQLPRHRLRRGLLMILGLVSLLILMAVVVHGCHQLDAWQSDRSPLTTQEAAALRDLASNTQDPAVWTVYQSESAHGLTRAGARRVEDAARAATPAYGLISGSGSSP